MCLKTSILLCKRKNCKLYKKSVEYVTAIENKRFMYNNTKKRRCNILKHNVKVKTMEALAKVVKATAQKEEDSACFLFGYQPKVPSGLKNKKQK